MEGGTTASLRSKDRFGWKTRLPCSTQRHIYTCRSQIQLEGWSTLPVTCLPISRLLLFDPTELQQSTHTWHSSLSKPNICHRLHQRIGIEIASNHFQNTQYWKWTSTSSLPWVSCEMQSLRLSRNLWSKDRMNNYQWTGRSNLFTNDPSWLNTD